MAESGLVHLIDDDEAVRDALGTLFDAAGLPVRTYASAEAFLAVADEVDDGCVVTDVRMPEVSGLELLHRLNGLGRTLPVIVLTGEADVPMAVEALKGGAADFLQKPVDDDAVLAAVRKALEDSGRRLDRQSARDERARRIAALSPREREVLDGLVAGHSNKMVAQALGISPRTVEVYRANLMNKLQAASLSDLVRMAVLADED